MDSQNRYWIKKRIIALYKNALHVDLRISIRSNVLQGI